MLQTKSEYSNLFIAILKKYAKYRRKFAHNRVSFCVLIQDYYTINNLCCKYK